jgi:diacylglycerol kinase (ATP)
VKNQPFLTRFGFALAGLLAAARGERSFRTQLLAGGLVILVMAILRPGAVWWAIVALAIAAVLATELLNTAIEALSDLVQPAADPRIKHLKDCAAAAALVAALGAVAVAGALAWSCLG